MVIAYKTPQQFLDAAESTLEKKELENNLIIGLSNGFPDKTKEQENCVFINAFDGDKIMASSIKTAAKAIVSGSTQNIGYLKELADYYQENNIDLKGSVGENFYSTEFSNFYAKRHITEMTMIAHRLVSVNKLANASGKFEMAGSNDIELMTEWTLKFEDDKKASSRNSKEKISEIVQARIGLGNIFKWIDKGKVVSMAGIARKTRNVGIVAMVYTPEEYRGKGYATSTVKQLSEHVLQSGFKYCGLFTDKANPTSNHIYKKIGYEPITEFADIVYLP